MKPTRFYQEHALYYLTFSVIDWLPVFVSEASCLIVTDSLNYCHREKHLRTNAFVIMPTHMHWIGFDAEFETKRLGETLTALRKFTGQRLSEHCDQHMPKAFAETMRRTGRTDRERQFWQQSRHPEAIYKREFWQTKANYLHDNPRRKGLVLDPLCWRFSSAAYWLGEPQGHSDVALSAVEW
jgi:putative transposase